LVNTLLLSAVVTCAACYPVLLLLCRGERLDVPNTRSSHVVPTPRGGGLALLAGVAAAALAAQLTGPAWSTGAWVAVLACGALALVGLTDDLRGLAAGPRLLAQVAIGAAAGAALGGGVGAALGAVIIPAAVNMVNFMDGINGICAGHAVVWGVAAMVAAPYAGGDVLTVLGALSVGCGLGFLPWNVPQARLFLGDVGSYLIGGLAGVGVLFAATETISGDSGVSPWPLLGLVCAPYLLFAVDTATAIFRRALAGAPIFRAHRSHTYQRLANELTLPHWAVSAFVVALSGLATTAVFLNWLVGVLIALVVSAVYLASPRLLRSGVPA